MNTKKILSGLIIATGVIFAVALDGPAALIAAALGLAWLVLELYDFPFVSTVFFLAFAGLAVVGGLNGAPVLLSLLGLSTVLAAWDLSRFNARIVHAAPQLPARHLQQLAVTVGAGYLAASLPALIELSLGFGAVVLLIVLAVLVLRKSVLYL